MLATAEELLGPYVWGVYDLLVLPPSFPYGGMENPCLTFVTPTLLVRKLYSHVIVPIGPLVFKAIYFVSMFIALSKVYKFMF